MIRWRFPLLFLLALSAIYLYAYPTATIIYGGGVLLHTGAGILLAVLPFRFCVRSFAMVLWKFALVGD